VKWECAVEDLIVAPQMEREELTRQLDKLGEDGWEAVAVSAAGPTPSGALQYRTILKRERREDGFGAVGVPAEGGR
jgi:hypothetical protein